MIDDEFIDPVPWIVAPSNPIKGRGAVSNIAGRYETRVTEVIDDGWGRDPAEQVSVGATEVVHEFAKTILSRNQSPDLPFSVSLNPYRVITPIF